MQMIGWLLKFLLLSFLGIFGVLIVVCGILLIAPFRYQIYLEKYDKLAYEIKFQYLGVIRGLYKLEDGKKEQSIKVFWKELHGRKLKDTSKKVATYSYEIAPSLKEEEGKRKNKITKEAKAIKKEKALKKTVSYETDQKARKGRSLEKSQSQKQRNAFHIELLKEKWLYAFLKEIIILVKKLFFAIGPKNFSFELVLGEEDPADTGELIAKVTMLFPLYYRYGVIRGNYERSCKEGGFLAEGKIRLGTLIKLLIGFLSKQSVRKMIKYLMKK